MRSTACRAAIHPRPRLVAVRSNVREHGELVRRVGNAHHEQVRVVGGRLDLVDGVVVGCVGGMRRRRNRTRPSAASISAAARIEGGGGVHGQRQARVEIHQRERQGAVDAGQDLLAQLLRDHGGHPASLPLQRAQACACATLLSIRGPGRRDGPRDGSVDCARTVRRRRGMGSLAPSAPALADRCREREGRPGRRGDARFSRPHP